MTIRFSIIIATWNADKTLQACLDSIKPQKNNTEVIIIDGGSKDQTRQIISSSDIVDRWISEPDNGIYDAWNKGISLAKGEWILFIGADDILLPNALNKWQRCISENTNIENVDYICAKNEWVDAQGKLIKVIGKPWVWNQVRKRTQFAHVASLHRCRLFQEVGPYDLSLKICGDTELLLRKGDALQAHFLNDVITRMTIGGASYSFKAIRESYRIRLNHHTMNYFTNRLFLLLSTALYFRHKYATRLFALWSNRKP